jgi:hypothetical protein
MEMNFPHDTVSNAANTVVSLRTLDMDILRVLAFAPRWTRHERQPVESHPHALLAMFAGTVRADKVEPGSFNPHFAAALNHLGAAQQQGESGVYHSASVNRKAARLLPSHASPSVSHCTSQAF